MSSCAQVLDHPGPSLDDMSGDPGTPRQGHAALWAVVAMLGVFAMGAAIETLVSASVEPAEPSRPTDSVGLVTSDDGHTEITSIAAVELCRPEMLNLSITAFSVPSYIPDHDGTNLQASTPWHPGTRVKVIPHREGERSDGSGALEPRGLVVCTIPGD